LSAFYFVGFIMHGMDLFDFRLHFSTMTFNWKAWTVYLVVFDFLAAIGLFKGKRWGEIYFLLVAGTQIIVYTKFRAIFGNQNFMINFHIVCLVIYVLLKGIEQIRKKA
jgi:hypothetical protein